MWPPAAGEPEPLSGWSVNEVGALVEQSRQEFGRGGGTPPGTSERLSVTGVYTYTAEVVPTLDTAVVVSEPRLLEKTSGALCSSPSDAPRSCRGGALAPGES